MTGEQSSVSHTLLNTNIPNTVEEDVVVAARTQKQSYDHYLAVEDRISLLQLAKDCENWFGSFERFPLFSLPNAHESSSQLVYGQIQSTYRLTLTHA